MDDKKMKVISEGFISNLGKFVSKEKKRMIKLGLNKLEVITIQSMVFKILGKDADKWQKQLGIKKDNE
jgi:hypothetical protein